MDKSKWFKPGSDLTEGEEKYCKCLLEVQDKNNGKYNTYSVCAASTKHSTGRKGCGNYYDFAYIPDKYLRSYLDLRKIKYPVNASRDQLIDIIYESKEKYRK